MLQCVRCGEIHTARAPHRGAGWPPVLRREHRERRRSAVRSICRTATLRTAPRRTAIRQGTQNFASLQITEIQLIMVKRPSSAHLPPRSRVAPLDCAPRPARARYRREAWLPVPDGRNLQSGVGAVRGDNKKSQAGGLRFLGEGGVGYFTFTF